MFDRDLILIKGERGSGKSTFTYNFSKYITSSGMKVCYVSCSDDIKYMDKHFELVKSLTSQEYNNSKTIQVINEIIVKEKIDYLIVDDIDFLTKNCIDSLLKIQVKKVFTFTEFIMIKMPEILAKEETIKISSHYDDNNLVESYQLESFTINEHFTNISELLKNKLREKKINTILNEK